MFKASTLFIVVLVSLCLFASNVSAQTTEFTYQGSLKDGVNPANGNHDFEFRLFDALSGGVQIGSLVTRSNVTVSGGTFSVTLDFGNTFPGANRFLEVRVRNTGGTGFTVLDPRQKLVSSPYSVKSLSTDNALQLDGIAANQYTLTTDPRLSDPRNPLPNSGNYIQNTTLQQAASNFNISGSGTAAGTLAANLINARTQFNLDGDRFIGARLSSTTYLGLRTPTTGFNNTYIGDSAGFGGDSNTMVGYSSGSSSTGGSNTIVGSSAGIGLLTGSDNSFFGIAAGHTSATGVRNSAFGSRANLADGLTNATAIGADAFVTQNNSLVLGSINSVNGSFADTNVGIGTTAPERKFHIRGPASVEVMIESSDAGGRKWTLQSSSGGNGGRFEIIDRTANASRMTILDDGNVGVGTVAPADKLHVNGILRLNTLGAAGATHLCRNASNQISTCSSPRPYRSNIEDEVEGDQNDRIGSVLLNAVKEQQAKIESQQNAIDSQKAVISQQRGELDAFKAHICQQTPSAAFCSPKDVP